MGIKDYLIWDEDGGLSGFLNKPTQNEGVPQFISQGAAKSLASGNAQNPTFLCLADMDGSVVLLPPILSPLFTKRTMSLLTGQQFSDGKDDYVYIDEARGALLVSYNRGVQN